MSITMEKRLRISREDQADIDRLKAEYAVALKALNAANLALVKRAMESLPFKVGDKVSVTREDGKVEIGRITKLTVAPHVPYYAYHMDNDPGIVVDIKLSIYPIKKNGETAQIGEIYVWDSDTLEVIPEN